MNLRGHEHKPLLFILSELHQDKVFSERLETTTAQSTIQHDLSASAAGA
jgi:hypothetical protein